jgi:hypothetical protein
MDLRFFLSCTLVLMSATSVWADPENTIALINKDKAPGYIFIIHKIYNKNAPNGYILEPSLLTAHLSKEGLVFPTPTSSTPYEVKITDSNISIGKPLAKWPKTIESGKCMWYAYENGSFKYIGKSPIHYGDKLGDYYCEPIKE